MRLHRLSGMAEWVIRATETKRFRFGSVCEDPNV